MQPSPVVTPEAVLLEFETPAVASRLLALLIDWAIQGALVATLLIGIGAIASASASFDSGLSLAFVFVMIFVIVFGYPTAMETLWRGRTVGKAALGLRVVTVEGAPVRFRHAAIRATFGSSTSC